MSNRIKRITPAYRGVMIASRPGVVAVGVAARDAVPVLILTRRSLTASVRPRVAALVDAPLLIDHEVVGNVSQALRTRGILVDRADRRRGVWVVVLCLGVVDDDLLDRPERSGPDLAAAPVEAKRLVRAPAGPRCDAWRGNTRR